MVWRTTSVGIEFRDGAVTVTNLLRSVELSSEDIAAVVLKRFGSSKPVQYERISLNTRLATVYGVRLPGLSFVLRSGGTTPIASTSIFVGSKNRDALLQLTEAWSRQHGVDLQVRNPNAGWICGVLWDIRRSAMDTTSDSTRRRSQ
jgi:hypothetical protein